MRFLLEVYGRSYMHTPQVYSIHANKHSILCMSILSLWFVTDIYLMIPPDYSNVNKSK